MQPMVIYGGGHTRAMQPGSLSMSITARQAALANRLPTAFSTPTQPFETAEHAWLWTMAALSARRDGARYTANKGLVTRPCDPDDVVKCLDALYRQGRIELAHARVLRIWGERQMAPSQAVAAEHHDRRLWIEALQRLEWPLGVKGIVR